LAADATRRRFVAGAVAVAGGAGIAGLPLAAAAQGPFRFRFQGAWSPKDIFHEYALDYVKQVSDMSGGRLRIEVFPAGAVVRAHEMIDAVQKGVLDGCHGMPRLWHGKSPVYSLFGGGPAFGMSANEFLAWMEYGGGRELYGELQAQTHSNVLGFLYGPMPTQALGWFKRPVASAAQLKGLRLRSSGLAADMYRELGAAVGTQADDEIVPALSSGLLDAAEHSNVSSDRRLGLPDAARFCVLQSYHRAAEALEVLFNRSKFEALPADLRQIVRAAAQAASADMSWKAIHRYSNDYRELRDKQGVRFSRASGDILRAQLRAWSRVVARNSAESLLFKRVIDSQLAWARRTVDWAQATAVDSRVAYNHWFGAKGAAAPTKS
jgi:TRAP-type mannitol/chloroaromatic compound transport system substrate-binding protein